MSEQFSHDHATMEQAALEFAARGLRVLLVAGIRPDGRCTCWRDSGGGKACEAPGKHPARKDWKETATSDVDEIKKWKFHGFNIGVTTGLGSNDVAIDIDPRHGGFESLKSLEAQYGPLPDTLRARTGGGGFHYHYRPRLGVPMRNREGILPGIDVRADGGFIMMPPSRHESGNRYSWDGELGFAAPIEEIPQCLFDLIIGVTPKASRGRAKRSAATDEIPEGLRNSECFRIARECFAKGWDQDRVYEHICQLKLANGDHPFTDEEKRQTVENAKNYPIGKGKRDEGGGDKKRTVEAFSLVTDTIIGDTIYVPEAEEPLRYAVADATGIRYVSSIEHGNKVFVPGDDINGLIAEGVAAFPSAASDYGTEAELDTRISNFIHKYCDLPPFWKILSTTYIKMSWMFDRFSALPYLRFLGGQGSGKTRMAYVVSRLCYRTCTAAGASSVAAFYRTIARFRGTLFLDEADYGASDLASEIAKVLNCGYKRGLKVLKCDADNNPESFDVFGPKVISARKEFGDSSTNSRCLTLTTQQKSIREDIDFQMPETFEAEAGELRNQLLMWRLRRFREIAVTREIEAIIRGLVDPRTVEIIGPLLAVSNGDEFRDELIKLCCMNELEQRHASDEAFIVQAIRTLSGKRPVPQPVKLKVKWTAAEASRLRQEQEPPAVLEAMKHGRGGEGPPVYFNWHRTGHLVRSLGIQTAHRRDGADFEVTEAKLRELDDKYPWTL